MDALAALRLQIDWGADEALDDAPLDRTRASPPPAAPFSRPAAPVSLPAAPVSLPAAPVSLPAAPVSLPLPPRTAAVPALATPAERARAVAAAATTPGELRRALEGFDACALRDTAGHLVFDADAPATGLVLVGEVPGAEEDRTGTPFAGPAGQLLDRMLGSIGLDRSMLAMAMLVPWRPPGGRPPTETELAICLPFLLRHLALLRPRLLVPMGSLATRAVTGSTLGIRRLRGRLTEAAVEGLEAPVRTLPMLHPAHLLRTPGAKREAWGDLLQLQTLLARVATEHAPVTDG